MVTIPPLPRGVAGYVAAFDLASIAITRDRRLVSRNPAGVRRRGGARRTREPA